MSIYSSVNLVSPKTVEKTYLGKLQGNLLQKEIKSKAKILNSLINGNNRHMLDDRGCLVIVNGAWGVGKTVSTHALVNRLKYFDSEDGHDSIIDVHTESFLPFGNVNESISAFLNKISDTLWRRNIVDARNEIHRFIMEATPSDGSENAFEVSFGPITISKSWTTKKGSPVTLDEKFRVLTRKKKTLVVIIDDIDRLQSSEMTAVLRLAEKMRSLPRTIVILPMYKKAVSEAITQELSLSSLGAADSFLRKLTDVEIRLAYKVGEIRAVFRNEFEDFENIRMPGGYTNFSDFCWCALLHCMILEEALEYMRNSNLSDAALINDVLSKSNYLRDLCRVVYQSENMDTERRSRYPVVVVDNNGRRYIAAISRKYQGLRSKLYSGEFTRNLESMLNMDEVFMSTLSSKDLKVALYDAAAVELTSELYDNANKEHLFKVLLSPLLRMSRSESFLTELYSMRDIKLIAREIMQHRDFKIRDTTPYLTFLAVQKAYREFRFNNVY